MFVDVYFCSSELLARALQPLSDVSMCVCVCVWLDHVILVTSQSSKLAHSHTTTRIN